MGCLSTSTQVVTLGYYHARLVKYSFTFCSKSLVDATVKDGTVL